MARLACQTIDRTRRQLGPGSIEAFGPTPAKPHGRRSAERDPQDMLEDWPILVPADARAGIVADQQRLDELIGIKFGNSRGALAQRQQPVRYRRRGACFAGREIVAPAERRSKPLAFPLLELEGLEPLAIDAGDESLLLLHLEEIAPDI